MAESFVSRTGGMQVGKSMSGSWYQKHAQQVSAQYESVDAQDVHGWLLDYLPTGCGRILDVGAGSGRDAAWLDGLGHDVVAVEPSPAMREEAMRRHGNVSIQWLDERLPDLPKTSRQGPFDLILLSAVWMHVPVSERKRAFRKLIHLLKPQGTLAVTLRLGPGVAEREVHAVSPEELETLAYDHGAFVACREESRDCLGREDVRWVQIAIRFPNDGAGTLPLLRHIILKQNKSATYKLALLRTLCRIAEGAAGVARINEDDTVSIPMGLVALTWLRLFMPLLDRQFPQHPTNIGHQGLGFVKEAFLQLSGLSHLDLRMGMRVGEESGAALHQALKDAAANIKAMPATYMTYPNGGQILKVQSGVRRRRPKHVRLDEDYLFSFGEMRVPQDLWQTLRKHAVWVEPVVVSEWSEMIRSYAQGQDRQIDESRIKEAMIWAEPERDTRVPRNQALLLLEGKRLFCVWSGKRLRKDSLDMDHCLPWSVWSCGDLWNLMPAHRTVNQNKKRDLLPSDSVMDAAEDRILDWWGKAYSREALLQEQFFLEAASSLPGIQPGDHALDEIFESVCLQRAKLRRDQQAPEWDG